MYGDLLLDRLSVKFLGPAPLHLELLHMLSTFHWNALVSDAAICITVLRISNDLRQNRFHRGADEHHTCPRGKHGCAIKFHFSESEQNVLP